MSELYQEQHPLLCEDLSDDVYNTKFYQKLRPATFRGRARNKIKGAAAILANWPDHWSSTLTYWWVGLGMTCLMTFVIYNCLFACPIVQIANSKITDSMLRNVIDSTTTLTLSPYEVYMHLFVKNNEEIDVNEYVPYIKNISHEYDGFKYNLLVIYNDTYTKRINDEQNNENAMNMLWRKDKITWKKPLKKSNINIEYLSLTTYMDSSPVNKFWRNMPHNLVEFLVRAISVWNKGGLVFNPNIIKPKSPHSIYKEKLKNLLQYFTVYHNTERTKYINTTKLSNDYRKQKLNNIRDIINALQDSENAYNNISHETLVEAENSNLPTVMKDEHHLLTETESETRNENKLTTKLKESYGIENIGETTLQNNMSSRSFLPLFLERLFQKNTNNTTQRWTKLPNVLNRKRNSVTRAHVNNNSSPTNPDSDVKRKLHSTYAPLIISPKDRNKSDFGDKVIKIPLDFDVSEKFDSNRLIIDLKGNIIATGTPCHAFLGSIFANIIHHSTEETVTDFIIAELSVFCKGLLSSCIGIDLLLQ